MRAASLNFMTRLRGRIFGLYYTGALPKIVDLLNASTFTETVEVSID